MSTLSAREHLAGLGPVYFNPNALDKGFASTPESLTPDIRVDAVTLASALVWPGVNALMGNFTHIEGVRRLEPGDTGVISQGILAVQSNYPTENNHATFEDAAARVGAALKRNIAQIVAENPGRVSSDCSGGLDSTTLALAAAGQCPPTTDILALVQYSNRYPAGDIVYARKFAQLHGSLVLRELVTSEQDLPFARIPWPDVSPSEPYRGTGIFAREYKRILAARAYHLTGDGGDALFDPEPMPAIVDLLSQGEQDLANALALHIGRAELCNPAAIIERAHTLSRTNLQQSYERIARQLAKNEPLQPSMDWLPPLGLPSTWLTPTMREAVAARAAEFAAKANDISFGAFATKQAIRDSGDAHRHLRMLAQRCGVELIAPYLAETVLKPAIELPASLRMQPGQFKPLLHAAAQAVGLAPEAIFTRQGKGLYSAEQQAGFEKVKPQLKEEFKYLRLARLGIVEPEAVIASLFHRRPPLSSITQLLASEIWLAHIGVEPAGASSLHHRTSSPSAVGEPLSLSRKHYTMPPSLHVTVGDTKVVGFDYSVGEFRVLPFLNNTTRLIVKTLFETGSPRSTLQVLRARYSDIPEERLAVDLDMVIDGLTKQGWLKANEAGITASQQVLTFNLPWSIAQKTLTYIDNLDKKKELTDAHHFASTVRGRPEPMLRANRRAANIVRTGIEIQASQIAVGVQGVVGVLQSTHGFTHALHSFIGLDGGNCLSVFAKEGNIGVAPISDFVEYYKERLATDGFSSDIDKVRVYTER